MKRAYCISVTCGFAAGLIAQFVWKMIYFPEPIIPVILEIAGIVVLASVAIWFIVRIGN